MKTILKISALLLITSIFIKCKSNNDEVTPTTTEINTNPKEKTFEEVPDGPDLTAPVAGSDDASDSNFVFENFVGEEIYKTDYVEERCDDDYYALNENDINPMRFIVSKNKMIVKGPLVDLIINGEGIPEMIITINSLTKHTREKEKNASLYDATCSFKVLGGSYANTRANLKIWSVNDEIVSIRINTTRKRNCRYSFMTSKTNESEVSKSSVSTNMNVSINTNVSNKQNQGNRKAEFQGSKESFNSYIMKNLEIPQSLKNSNAVFEVEFKIDKDGTIKATGITSSIPSTGRDEDTILRDEKILTQNIYELFSRLPKWKPSFNNGNYIDSEDSIKIYLK